MDRIGTLIICSAGRHQDVISLSRMKAGNADAGVSTVRSAAGVVVIAADDLERVTRRLFVSGIQYLEHLNERVLIVEVAAGAGMDACGFVRGGELIPDRIVSGVVHTVLMATEAGVFDVVGGGSVVGRRDAAAALRFRGAWTTSSLVGQLNLKSAVGRGRVPTLIVGWRGLTFVEPRRNFSACRAPFKFATKRLCSTHSIAAVEIVATSMRANPVEKPAEPTRRTVSVRIAFDLAICPLTVGVRSEAVTCGIEALEDGAREPRVLA